MTRLKTFGWFLLTLAIVALLLAPPPAADGELSRPTSVDRRSSGVAAFAEWLAAADIPVISIRDRFDQQPWEALSATGNLLVLHLPATLLYEAEEVAALLEWVARGNQLLIAAGFLEGSAWIYRGNDLNRSLWRLTGLYLEPFEPPEAEPSSAAGDEATESEVVDEIAASIDAALTIPGWLLQHGSREAVALDSASTDRRWRALGALSVPWDRARWRLPEPGREVSTAGGSTADAAEAEPEDELSAGLRLDQRACGSRRATNSSGHALSGRDGCIDIPAAASDAWQLLLRHRNSEQPVLLEARVGAGRTLLLLQPSLLGNEAIHRFDNRAFAMRLIQHYVAAGGAVLLDDAHQGLNRIVEAEDLLRDWRLYASIGFLLMFWVGYLLADAGQWQRACYRPRTAGVGQQALVAANSNFLRNRLQPQATSELVLEPLIERLAQKWRLPRAEALVRGLALERSRHPQAVAALERELGALERGRTVPPVRLAQQVRSLVDELS